MGDRQEQTQQTSGTSQQSPWSPQASALQDIFSRASSAYSQSSGTSRPSQFVSQFTPDQLSVFSRMLGAADNASSSGNNLISSGSDATTTGLGRLSSYSPTSMSSILSDANAAANDPSVDARIKAATRDAERSVYEGELPQLDRSAALNNNLMSSRSGVSEGILRRGLADTVADTSANIRGDAYRTGLQASLSRALTGDSNTLGALSTLVSGGNNTTNTGGNLMSGLYDIATRGISGQQSASQASIDDALARYQFGTSSPFDALNYLYSIIGGRNWGGTTTESGTSTRTTEESPYSTIGRLLTAAGSFGSIGRSNSSGGSR